MTKKQTFLAITSWNAANSYNIFDQAMQRIYMAMETSSTMSRQFFNTHASFTMHLLDYTGQEVITVFRPTKGIFDDVSDNGFGFEFWVEKRIFKKKSSF